MNSAKPILAMLRTFGVKIENVTDSQAKTEEEITQALDLLEGAAFRDRAETYLISATINGGAAVIIFTTAPNTLVQKAAT